MAQYYPSHSGVLLFGLENGMLSPTSDTLGPLPTLNYMGYGSIPNIQRQENAELVKAVGIRNGVDLVPGNRTVTFGVSLKLGSLGVLPYLYQGGGISPNFWGLPVLALFGGSDNRYAGTAFAWAVRYAICTSFTLRYQEGSAVPVGLDAQFMGLALDPDSTTQTVDAAAMLAAAGRVLTWSHTSISIGGTAYRRFLGSAVVNVNNNCQPVGTREGLAMTHPLFNAPGQIMPGDETLNVQLSLKDRLPANAVGDLGSIVIASSNSAYLNGGEGTKNLAVTISKNFLNSSALTASEPGQPIGFTADTVSQGIGIAIA